MAKRTTEKTKPKTQVAEKETIQGADDVLKRVTKAIRKAGFKITWQLAEIIIVNGVTNAEELLAAVASTGAQARARYVPEGTILTINI
jgi:thioredoxin-like negative regulator of GroEL